jgi:hypothetical protein
MNNKVHILEAITIKLPLAGCSLVIPAQTAGTVTFENFGGSLIEVMNDVGFLYHGSGGLCGSSLGTFGDLSGINALEALWPIAFDE